jgi:hypothetical protein
MNQLGLLRLFGCLALCPLADSSVGAQEDRLARAFLGVNSIPVRFPHPKGQEYGYLAVAQFKDGKFIGYAKLLSPVESLTVADRPKYEAELGWAPKEGVMQFVLVTPSGVQGPQIDEAFEKLTTARFLALDRLPSKRLGPYHVLGFAAGGPGKEVKPEDSENVEVYIRNEWRVIVLLICWFESEKQAKEFSKAPPVLTVK